MEKLWIASDHAAFDEKQQIIEHLKTRFEVIDLGPDSKESTHYPLYGKRLALEVLKHNGRGIALCGSGIGISIAVNRYQGIRGALCRSVDDAKMSRLHNNSNIICLGARSSELPEMIKMIDTWLDTPFEGGRHQMRVDMLDC